MPLNLTQGWKNDDSDSSLPILKKLTQIELTQRLWRVIFKIKNSKIFKNESFPYKIKNIFIYMIYNNQFK